MARIETGYEIEGFQKVFNTKNVLSVDCNYINWTSNQALSTFINSQKLEQVTNLSVNITEMDSTFENCVNFIYLDAFPPNVIYLNDTFHNCSNLKSVPTIPNTVVRMSNTFRNCISMTNAPAIPTSVHTANAAFQGCVNLKYASSIGKGLTAMHGTFKDCHSLVSVGELPETLHTLANTFQNCNSIVTLPNIPSSVTVMYGTYKGCSRITDSPVLPNSVTNMINTFQDCVNLRNAPVIPNSITELPGTFNGCLKLVNIPTLPNSITSLPQTYQSCINLVNMPLIPASVHSLPETFRGCTKLSNIKSIPTSVTNMYKTFYGCTNIKNDLIITSQNITDVNECFNGTSVIKNVYIPFTYDNRVNTKTYNSFLAAGYKEDGSVNGVRLRDLSIANVTIKQTPADSTVILNAAGYSQGPNTITVKKGTLVTWQVEHYGYQTLNGSLTPNTDQTITVTLSKDNFVFTINPTPADALVTLTVNGTVHQGKSISVPYESMIHWKVEHPNYFPQEGDIELLANITQDIALIKTHYDVTINPTPADSYVDLEVFTAKEEVVDLYAWDSGNVYTLINESASNIRCYYADHTPMPLNKLPGLPTTVTMVTVTCYPDSRLVANYIYKANGKTYAGSRSYGRSTSNDIMRTIYTPDPRYVQSGHTITVPYMGNVHWKVSHDEYNTREGEYLKVVHDITENIVLVDPNAEIYIDSNKPITTTWTVPKDGIYEIIAVGAGGGGSTSSVNIKHWKYAGLLSRFKTKYSYEQAIMSASGGSGAMSRTYYKFKAGQVFEYRIGAGGKGKRTTADTAAALRAEDGQSTYLADLVIAGGGQGGLTKASESSAIREAGTGGVPTQTGYMSLKEKINGNKGTTKTNSETAIGAASVYSNYGAGGDAQGTIEGGNGVKNGGNGYLKITCIAADPLFESDRGGSSEQIVISYTGKYNIVLVGAGGGYGYAKAYQGGPYWHSASGGGGAGAEIIGTTTLTAGTYTATIGLGGGNAGGVNKFNERGGTGGTTGLSSSNTTLASANGGTGGGYKSGGTGGNGSTSISALTIKPGSNGSHKGASAYDGGLNANGGVSTYDNTATGYGAGAGGNNSRISKSGYIRIEWVGE